jgi:hypothetical protein
MNRKSSISLDQLKNSAVWEKNKHKLDEPAKPAQKAIRKPRKDSKAKQWLNMQLWAWGQEKGLELKTEHKFHEFRKWRFDWCFPALMVGIEHEGLMSEVSRHTTVTGYTGDTDKYRIASMEGWVVLRYTVLNYKQVIQDLDKIFKEKKF